MSLRAEKGPGCSGVGHVGHRVEGYPPSELFARYVRKAGVLAWPCGRLEAIWRGAESFVRAEGRKGGVVARDDLRCVLLSSEHSVDVWTEFHPTRLWVILSLGTTDWPT